MSYLHGLYLKTTKRQSYDGYSIYIAIFSSFLQGVYPVYVTEVRSYFTQIIGHNSMNVHCIPTKLGTEIHFNEPFICAKFQPYWSTHWCFVADFAKCVKRSRRKGGKNEEIQMKFWPLVSEMAEAIFFKFGM